MKEQDLSNVCGEKGVEFSQVQQSEILNGHANDF